MERCHAKGARGVGELTDKGWGLEASAKDALPRNKRMHLDDPRLDLFWKKCVELKMPVNTYVADHPSCWQPLGPNQERTPDFQHFNLAAKDVPSHEELLKSLDRYPNLYLDISARDYELGRQPRTAARFLARYKERIL